jgi:pimeloyl-ACP methyl ester carboxylesterase
MLFDVVLIQGPLVGASGMTPLAERLRARGLTVHVPDVLCGQNSPPPWSAWSSHLLGQLSLSGKAPVLVGYSASTVLAVELATKLPSQGVVFLDGDIPPASGRVAPGSTRVRQRVEALAADSNGLLPLWSEWFSTDADKETIGITALKANPDAWRTFERDQPRMPRSWFHDEIDLAPWEGVPAGYVRVSKLFDQSAREAEERGWPVVRISGTHLHPVIEPEETAAAILEACRGLT